MSQTTGKPITTPKNARWVRATTMAATKIATIARERVGPVECRKVSSHGGRQQRTDRGGRHIPKRPLGPCRQRPSREHHEARVPDHITGDSRDQHDDEGTHRRTSFWLAQTTPATLPTSKPRRSGRPYAATAVPAATMAAIVLCRSCSAGTTTHTSEIGITASSAKASGTCPPTASPTWSLPPSRTTRPSPRRHRTHACRPTAGRARSVPRRRRTEAPR